MKRSIPWISGLALVGAVAASNAGATSGDPEGSADLAIDESPAASSDEEQLQAADDPKAGGGYGSYALKVTKTVYTSCERTWTWTIDKSGSKNDLYLKPASSSYGKSVPGDSMDVEYRVKLDATEYTDSCTVEGKIKIYNPTYKTATITAVKDVISGEGVPDIEATVVCPSNLDLASHQTLECTYSATVSRDYDKNTATVYTDPYGYVQGGSAYAPVTFDAEPTTTVDECVYVTDVWDGTYVMDKEKVCRGDYEKTLTYTMQIGPYDTCGDRTVKNTVEFTTHDTQTTGTDYHDVYVKVPCPEPKPYPKPTGCTRTQGYWKTHSKYGPAKYDKTWSKLPYGEKTYFYKSGRSWYSMFWMPPKKGSVYVKLAHQYMAAMLNKYAGADTYKVEKALADAKKFFQYHAPWNYLSKEQQKKLLYIHDTLDKYNNGQLGPKHCDKY